MFDTLIDAQQLHCHLQAPELVVVDCRFDLGVPEAGRANWLEGHVPGARYADLEADLSGPPRTDRGRHPLPSAAELCRLFGRLGIDTTSQVVAYDDNHGMVAARLWWMLRYLGHRAVAVLDGGWPAWVAAGLPLERGAVPAGTAHFTGRARRKRLVTLDEVGAANALLDAREPARFRGEVEPIDPVAGHIPGARNHCWRDNLGADGRFLAPAELRARLAHALGRSADDTTVHYCGSGVSACHNVLAQVVAGWPEPRLYCGSWSEWCRDPSRQVMMGDA